MNLRILSKISFLLVALTATIYAVFQLNTGHMNDFWTSLGIGKNSQSLNWCNDRLISLSGTDNNVAWTMQEENGKWIVIKNGNDTKTLEYLDVEKWLAKYCILDIETHKGDALEMAVTPIAVATFNDKTTVRLFALGNQNVYQINTVIFTSEELQQALLDLKNLLKL